MSNRDAILLEDMSDKLDILLEGQQAMSYVPAAISQLQDDMTEVKVKVRTIELAVTDLSQEHCQLGKRVANLEQAA
ncbi:MAG TPA: hypothetical protein VM535_02170 [Candidatus Saccharimonadales bacterium]|nr:hypothetical protein [Candidatus Saccharimonadales bacterium]